MSKTATRSSLMDAVEKSMCIKMCRPSVSPHPFSSSLSSPLTDGLGAGRSGVDNTRYPTRPVARFRSLMMLAQSHSQCWFNLMLMCPFCTSETKFCSMGVLHTSSRRHPRLRMWFLSSAVLKNKTDPICASAITACYCPSQWTRHYVRNRADVPGQPESVWKDSMLLDRTFETYYFPLKR